MAQPGNKAPRVRAALAIAGVVAAGLVLGGVLAGVPAPAVLGTIAALLAIGTAIYRPALGLAVLAFTYPYDLDTYVGPVKLTTSYVLLVILVLVWAGREVLPNAPDWRRTPLDWAVVLFGAASLLSILGLTGNYPDQIIAIVKAGGGFVLFFLATQSLREKSDVWLVVGAVAATGLIQAATTAWPAIAGSIAVSDQTRATGTVTNANLFAGYLVLVAPLALAATMRLRRRWAAVAGGVVTLMFAIALVATLSRSGWLGFLAGLITFAVLVPQRRREIAIIGGTVIAVVLLVGLAGPVAGRLGAAQGGSPMETFFSRVPIWSAAIAMFWQHPIFGVGINNFGYLLPSYDADLDVNQAHNLFLNIAVERGILGIAAFAFLIAVLFRSLVGTLKRVPDFSGRILTAAVAASMIGFCVHSLFDVSYYDYKILLMFWLLVGVAAVLPHLERPIANLPKPQPATEQAKVEALK